MDFEIDFFRLRDPDRSRCRLTNPGSKVRVFRVFLASRTLLFLNNLKMPPATPPLEFDYKPGQEIPTKYKKIIHQFYNFTKILIESLII